MDCEEIAKIFNFNKYHLEHIYDKFLYRLSIANYKDKYKFIQEYIKFSKENWVLSRKLEKALYFENKYRYYLLKKLKNILKKVTLKTCSYCGKPILPNSKTCINCYSLIQRKVERPEREKLKKLIRTESFLQIGRKFNVTDNAVRKWCKNYNLPFKKSDIIKYTDEEWNLI